MPGRWGPRCPCVSGRRWGWEVDYRKSHHAACIFTSLGIVSYPEYHLVHPPFQRPSGFAPTAGSTSSRSWGGAGAVTQGLSLGQGCGRGPAAPTILASASPSAWRTCPPVLGPFTGPAVYTGGAPPLSASASGELRQVHRVRSFRNAVTVTLLILLLKRYVSMYTCVYAYIYNYFSFSKIQEKAKTDGYVQCLYLMFYHYMFKKKIYQYQYITTYYLGNFLYLCWYLPTHCHTEIQEDVSVHSN